jgi:hypothetical protein
MCNDVKGKADGRVERLRQWTENHKVQNRPRVKHPIQVVKSEFGFVKDCLGELAMYLKQVITQCLGQAVDGATTDFEFDGAGASKTGVMRRLRPGLASETLIRLRIESCIDHKRVIDR